MEPLARLATLDLWYEPRPTMAVSPKRWLEIAVGLTAIVFVGQVLYLYGTHFDGWVESDAAAPVLLVGNILRNGKPVPTDWYFGNGDVWLLATHWFALLPVAIFGMGKTSTLVALVIGLTAQLATLRWAFLRFGGNRWIASFAAMLVLMAWSQFHVAFIYLQLSYGFHATVQTATFTCFALALSRRQKAMDEKVARKIEPMLVLGTTAVFLVAAANPLRGLVFILAPVIVACGWPWRGLSTKSRAYVGGVATMAWAVGYVVYKQVFLKVCTFTPWPSHEVFALRDGKGIAENLRMLGQGFLTLCGGGSYFVTSSPSSRGLLAPTVVLGVGLALIVAAAAVRYVLKGPRTPTLLRIVIITVAAQMGGALVPLVLGNLMEGPHSVRYVMTSVLMMFGLGGVVIANDLIERKDAKGVEADATPESSRSGRPIWRWVGMAWILAVPATALADALSIDVPTPGRGQWPDEASLQKVASELEQRHLSLGYSDLWNANILTLVSNGKTKTCPVFFDRVLVPQRWNVERYCYDRAALPERFYVVSYPESPQEEEAASRSTGTQPVERLTVGTYVLSVFTTANARLNWLDLPLADGEHMVWPFHLPAAHVAFRQINVEPFKNGPVEASGVAGTVLHGPYIALPKGTFHVRWMGSGIESSGELKFDLTSENGRTMLAQRQIPSSSLSNIKHGELLTFDVSLESPAKGVELRVFSDGGARVSLDEVIIERSP